MKKLFLFLIVSVLYAQEMDWRTFQRDMQRTGFTPFKSDFSNGFIFSIFVRNTFPPVFLPSPPKGAYPVGDLNGYFLSFENKNILF